VVECKGVVSVPEAGYAVLVAHDAGSGEHENKKIRRCRAPLAGFVSARPL